MPIWSVTNHRQYGQLTDKFEWHACSNADWSISPSHLTWPRRWPSITSALVHLRAATRWSTPSVNMSVSNHFKPTDCTIQKIQRHRVSCVQTLIGQHPPPIAPSRVRMIDCLVWSHVESDISRDFDTSTLKTMTSLNTVHDTALYTQRHFDRKSCIPDSTNFTSTVYIRHFQPIHIFIIYK